MKTHARSHDQPNLTFQEDKMKTHARFYRMLFVGLALVLGIILLSSLSMDSPRAAAQQPPAAPTVAAKQPSKLTQLPQITAASTVVQVGQWVTVTLTHGQPGNQGFFDAETPLRYKRTDGQPCTPGFACVTISDLGQAQVLVQAVAESDAVVRFKDTTTDQVVPASVRVRFYEGVTAPPPPLQDSKPHIQSVTPGYSPISGPYLIGLGNNSSVNNRVSVATDMGGKGYLFPYMLVSVNGKVWVSKSICDRDNGVCEFDLPFDNISNQYAPLQVGDNTLNIIVGTHPFSPQDDTRSDPYSFVVTAVQAPEWLSALNPTGDIHLTSDSSNLVYEMPLEYPVGGMNWIAPTLISDDGSSPSALVLLTQSTGHIVACKKVLFKDSVAIPFKVGESTKLYSIDLKGNLNASAEIDAEFVDCKVWNPQLDGSLTVTGTVNAQADFNLRAILVDYFGTTCASTMQDIIKHFPAFMGASLSGNMAPTLNAQVQINRQKPYVHGDITMKDPLTLNGSGYVICPLGWVQFNVDGGGNASFSVPNVTDFKDRTLNVSLGYEATLRGGLGILPVFYYKTSGQSIYPGYNSHSGCSASQTTMQLLRRSFTPTYAAFHATPGKRQAFSPASRSGLSAQATVTNVLVSDIYTYTSSALAISPSNDHALALWTHDVPTKALGTSHEIFFSRWDGLAWSNPSAVSNDDLMDGTPKVAWTSGSQAVAVWQRMAQSLPPTATIDITTTNLHEVASAVYNATTNTWSPPIPLTTNSVADVAPQLARNSNGQLLTTWLQNDHGLFIGDDAHPSRLMTAFFNGAWSQPTAAVDPITDVTDLAVGYGNGQATIVFARWITPTGALKAANQLFATTWDGSAWSAPRQLTYDTLNHMHVNVIYNHSHHPVIVWQTGDTLRLKNLQDGTLAAVRLPPEIGLIGQLQAEQDASDNIVALFTANHGQQDLYLAYYDRAHNLWGLPRQLTDDRHIETYADLALDSAGRPLAIYPVILQDLVTRTMTLSNGETVTFTMPTPRRTDLTTLSHTLTRNASLAADALSVSDPRPVPGSRVMVSAEVRNTGDLPLDGLAVSFYDGDPSAGGVLIGTSTRAWPLTGGFTTTLSVTYTVPAEGGPRTLYAIADPANAIAESDESDNQASLSAFGPDLHLADVQVRYPYGDIAQVRTVVRNLGTGTSPATTLAYYKDVVTGTLLLTQTIPALAYNESVTMVGGLDMSTLAEGEYDLYAVVNSGDLAPRSIGTKQRQFSLIVGPDVMVSEYSLWRTSLTGGIVRATAMVYNVGPITATNVSVYFRSRPEPDGGAPLATRTIAVLPPGQAAR
ncbi:MAG: hypothetical protein FJ026_02020, partial [Chloroflexi bacterium]|nr:hypothetical protein [Chloroflexota bacterium]